MNLLIPFKFIFRQVDWLILTVCQPIEVYFMLRGAGIMFIYLSFVYFFTHCPIDF